MKTAKKSKAKKQKITKRVQHCTVCEKRGHNSRTCEDA